MAKSAAHSSLGRGLAALIGDVRDEAELVNRARSSRLVPIEFLTPCADNPRQDYDLKSLEELSQSIREKGILQPILVRNKSGTVDQFEIIAGERRWRAAQKAELKDVPILLTEASDQEMLEFAIIENVQRADLNVIEEALAYQRLMDEFSYQQQDVARIIGKSRSHVANTLRLLKLPEPVKALVVQGKISSGHARALLALDNPEKVALEVVEKGLSVRDVETLAQRPSETQAKTTSKPSSRKIPEITALEQRFSETLGLGVLIKHRQDGGEIRIRYKSLDQLDDLCRTLGA